MTDPLVSDYFIALFSDSKGNRNLGRISNPDAMADAEGCRGGRDHLFVYLTIQDRRIVDIKFECATCDPAMLVTANILCNLSRGRDIRYALQLSQADFLEALGGQSQDIAEHCEPALKVLNQAIEQYCRGQGITLYGE